MVNYVRGKTPWERLLLHIRRTDSGCWEYEGARNFKGYGRINIAGRVMLAHRFAYQHFTETIVGSSIMVLHRCDNPPCCNPAHLYEGDAARNSRDMVERGRAGIGQRSSQAKLTDAKVLAIFADYAAKKLELKEIAARYGVTASCVCDLVMGRHWRHLSHLAPPPRRGVGGRRQRHATPSTLGSDST